MSAMTEADAKTKACCAGLGLGPHNQSDLPQFSACIGSRCMAWRWENGAFHSDYLDKMVINKTGSAREANGYCGLGGKP